jgi:hypothetical protein
MDKEMSVNLTNTCEFTPLNFSDGCCNLETMKPFVKKCAHFNYANSNVNPLMVAAQSGKM